MANPNGFPGGLASRQTSDARLDRPPPTPALATPSPTGDGFSGLAPPVVLGGDQPQANRDVLEGMLRTFERIDRDLSTMAKAAPALSPRLDRITDLIRSVSGELLTEGIVATDETAAGPGFPGGGFVHGR